MARFRHKHVLRTRRPHRGRLVRIGLAAAAVPTLAVPAAVIWSEAPIADMSMTRTAADRARTSPGPMRVATPLDAESPVELAEETSDDQGATNDREARTRHSGKARTLRAIKWADKVAHDGRTEGGPAEVVAGTERVPVGEPATTTKPTQEAGTAGSSDVAQEPVPASPTKSTATTTTTKKKPASKSETTVVATTPTKPAPNPRPAPAPQPAPMPASTTSPTPTPMPTDAPITDPTALPTETCTTSPDAPLGPTGPQVDPETCLPLPY